MWNSAVLVSTFTLNLKTNKNGSELEQECLKTNGQVFHLLYSKFWPWVENGYIVLCFTNRSVLPSNWFDSELIFLLNNNWKTHSVKVIQQTEIDCYEKPKLTQCIWNLLLSWTLQKSNVFFFWQTIISMTDEKVFVQNDALDVNLWTRCLCIHVCCKTVRCFIYLFMIQTGTRRQNATQQSIRHYITEM